MSDKSKASAVCMRSCLCGSQVDVGLSERWRALPRSVKPLFTDLEMVSHRRQSLDGC